MNLNNNWLETKQRFEAWWNRTETDRPLMWIAARRKDKVNSPVEKPVFTDPEDLHTNVKKQVQQHRYFLQNHILVGEAFANVQILLGAGSMALYLGSEPNFAWDTLWFKECAENGWDELGPLKYDENNYWWQRHLSMLKEAKELAAGEFAVTIPDIVENADILASLRGTQNLIFDFIDQPEVVWDYLKQIDDLYFKYYDAIYDIVKLEDNSSVYTVFQIWGPGKTAKLQCDFSAMLSPGLFKDMIIPSLRKQCQNLDNTVYHLDGPDAIKHLDALLEIEELDAIQWTPGAGKPDCLDEIWYPIYDKTVDAGKGLHLITGESNKAALMDKIKAFKERYGSKYLYFIIPAMDEKDAYELLSFAEK